jgi:hypothetical protein
MTPWLENCLDTVPHGAKKIFRNDTMSHGVKTIFCNDTMSHGVKTISGNDTMIHGVNNLFIRAQWVLIHTQVFAQNEQILGVCSESLALEFNF